MATNIEIEAKVLITKPEYEKIVKKYKGEEAKEFDQINYYIDTKNFDLKKVGIGLRIRLLNGVYNLTLKVPMGEGILEKNSIVSKKEYEDLLNNKHFPENDVSEFIRMLGYKTEDLLIVTSLETHRYDVNYGEDGSILSIDKNTYNGVTDYELEMGGTSLLKAKTLLQKICNENGVEYEDNPRSKQTRALESLTK